MCARQPGSSGAYKGGGGAAQAGSDLIVCAIGAALIIAQAM